MDVVDRIVGGFEKKNKIIILSEKKVIVFYEVGYVIVSWMLEYVVFLVKVIIVFRG